MSDVELIEADGTIDCHRISIENGGAFFKVLPTLKFYCASSILFVIGDAAFLVIDLDHELEVLTRRE